MATVRTIDYAKITGMTKRNKRAHLKRVASGALSAWKAMAKSLPHRYRQPYMRAMRISVSEGQSQIKLSLDTSGKMGKLVRSIEYGFGPGGVGTVGPYDMRTTLLKSAKARVGMNGKYLNVPMRRTKVQITSFGGTAAYRAALQLNASVRVSKNRTLWGGRLSNPSGFAHKIHKTARHVAGIGRVPAHATDPLASMYRFKKAGQRGSRYGVFRTISQGGKPWVHPGIKARRFMRKVAKMLPTIGKGSI